MKKVKRFRSYLGFRFLDTEPEIYCRNIGNLTLLDHPGSRKSEKLQLLAAVIALIILFGHKLALIYKSFWRFMKLLALY